MVSDMAKPALKKLSKTTRKSVKKKDSGPPCDEIEKRKTAELVVAFCGPLGSGVSTVIQKFKKVAENYRYDVRVIKLSDFIKKNSSKVGTQVNFKPLSACDKIVKLQDKGNELRQEFGNDILSQLAITEISSYRSDLIKKAKKIEQKPDGETAEESEETIEIPIKSIRLITVIDALKHPAEVQLLQKVYGNMFYLVGVLCPEALRKKRLTTTTKKINATDATFLMERDKDEDKGYGQKLLKTLKNADFFLRNDRANIKAVLPSLTRYVELILGKPDITPTRDEFAMFTAQSAACRSGCLSRKVGASIVNKKGDIIATGCNDVPKYGGGLYCSDDDLNDNRCFNSFNCECKNDHYKKVISAELRVILEESLKDPGQINTISKKISEYPRIKSLLEYSRAVHAEMDAIISVARKGNDSLIGTNLYTTTFPCHHCARHIVAAGIKRVYYIEPYEKSLAIELHSDSIELEGDPKHDHNKALFLHFEGVAPRQYLSLFSNPRKKR